MGPKHDGNRAREERGEVERVEFGESLGGGGDFVAPLLNEGADVGKRPVIETGFVAALASQCGELDRPGNSAVRAFVTPAAIGEPIGQLRCQPLDANWG